MKKYRLKKEFIFPNGGLAEPQELKYDKTVRGYVADLLNGDKNSFTREFVECDEEFFEEIEEVKKVGRCLVEPEAGELVYYVWYGTGGVIASRCCGYHDIFKSEFLAGHVFWDKESCQKEIARLRLLQELRQFAHGNKCGEIDVIYGIEVAIRDHFGDRLNILLD